MGVVGVTLACFTAPQVTVAVALVLIVIQRGGANDYQWRLLGTNGD